MDLIRGALESLDSILSSARRYEPSYSYDFRQKRVIKKNARNKHEVI